MELTKSIKPNQNKKEKHLITKSLFYQYIVLEKKNLSH